ncbi:cyclin-D4-1-like isoform X1 [Tripterygium wilfordii]|uniref:B-like cyclin n=1 Tax=Tripterygium wilfordii TaxID=458696 RepID=A0A7J7CGP6_TRIWF|nr:cyclin-D4-1-like isoform X2 [Tripterygium wilfordii]KAF5733216.1 cyclin-D4-1-like isoform X1 [Tripterygium wilfordii]
MSHSPDQSVSCANSLHCGEDAVDLADTSFSDHLPLSADDTAISRFVDIESQFMPRLDYLQRCRDRTVDVTARQDSIKWILKVHTYYHFRPVTALLSVNYLDRFLSSHSLPQANGWPFQLLSVACLSLAAKMEEPHVPLLSDLQLFEPRFVFEPVTIQRMELCVMANLSWRLRSITPFDYLHHFISKLPSCSSSGPGDLTRLLKASTDLILSTTRVIDFLDFAPSTIAAAAVLSIAFGEILDLPEFQFHERVNKEMVTSCHQLMEEHLIDACPSSGCKYSTADTPTEPLSPVGVLDAAGCGSCDTHSDTPGPGSQAEPEPKRVRSRDHV